MWFMGCSQTPQIASSDVRRMKSSKEEEKGTYGSSIEIDVRTDRG